MNWHDIPTIKDRVPHHNAKLTHDQVREIRKQLADGVQPKIIAIDFGISGTTVTMIKYRQVYRRVL
jgi:FixJ family two-component response regulator